MLIDVQRRVLDDGTEVIRRFDDSVFVSEVRVLKLPSGKTVMTQHDEGGRLKSESHSYGIMRIALTRDHDQNGTVTEMLFVNRKLVSRARYEKERAGFADMPPAEASGGDVGAELLAGVRAEHRSRRKVRAVPDSLRGQRLDEFCTALMSEGECVEVLAGALDLPIRLGEKSERSSKSFLATLRRQAAEAVWACGISRGAEGNDCNDLVVELPTDPAKRKALMRTAARVAHEQGFDAYADDGQRFVYLKM